MKKIKIIYSVSAYSEKKFSFLYEVSNVKSSQQIQKYHRMLIEGISFNKNIDLVVISKLPLILKKNSKKFMKTEFENYNNIKFLYLPLLNLPVLNNAYAFFCSLYYLNKESKDKTKKSVIIGDVLNLTTSIANVIYGKFNRIKTIGIVTDIPTFHMESSDFSKKSILKRRIIKLKNYLNEIVLRKYDSFIFLTEHMNTLVNTENKPYVVMEGHVDINMKSRENKIEEKYTKKVCVYSGSLKKVYGIDKLVKAFILANVSDSELHIYGSGDYEEEIELLCKRNKNIKFFGVKRNEYIIAEQIRSTLLINPRPVNEEYTKYSFPSKNMEYMASGTPTLTTKLPGMPEEYEEYVYLINDETIEALSETLKNILMLSRTELHEKGKNAKKFVINEKNNIIQAEKLKKLM